MQAGPRRLIQSMMFRASLLIGLTVWATNAWAGAGGGCGTGGNSVPEPASIAILGAGVGAILLYRKWRGPKK